MRGLMQDHELLISSLLEHAAREHGSREIVSREAGGAIRRITYANVERRARRLGSALSIAGIQPGDRVATLATSRYRHLECFYGVSGMGAVLHTVNPRLFDAQLTYIMNHAEDRMLLFDPEFLALVERIAPSLETVERFVVLGDRADVPENSSLSLEFHEELIAAGSEGYAWPRFDERQASTLCYTSGTTGHPKGVLYSHRSTVIHALSMLQADAFALRSIDSVMPIAPLFHATGWSLPYGGAMVGAKLVLPGHQLDAASLFELMQAEEVTVGVAVPTIWTLLLAYLQQTHQRLPKLERVIVAGTALSPAMQSALRDEYGIRAIHAWGMTETSPIGTLSTPTAAIDVLPSDERTAQLLKQGRVPWGVELKVTDAEGRGVARDGETSGALWVRGPWVASGYYKGVGGEMLDVDGWFSTGDVATIDALGFMKITDRDKDVIKSGGEWISSIDLENLAVAHPQVKLAAAVAVHHPKWDERPLLLILPKEGETPTKESLLEFLRPRVAKWWLPDEVVFVTEMPMTGTGKIVKSELRERYRNHLTHAEHAPTQ